MKIREYWHHLSLKRNARPPDAALLGPVQSVPQCGMDTKTATEISAAAIDRLTAELVEAHKQLDATFHTDPPGDVARDAGLARYLASAQNVLNIIRRIKELKGA
jgi:hypothetical protein